MSDKWTSTIKNLIFAFAALTVFLLTDDALAWQMEADEIILPSVSSGSTTFQTVSFRQTYNTVPLVFILPSNENSEPASIRIRNVTTTDFEVAQVEPPGEDGVQPATTVHYLAIESGVHALPDNTILEAGTISTMASQQGLGVTGSDSYETVNFTTTFTAAPAILGQIQTMANVSAPLPPGNPSITWLTTAIDGPTTTSVNIALERSEANDGSITSNETIAYLAFEIGTQGSFTDNSSTSISFETVFHANVEGWNEGCYTANFAGTYSVSPIVIASLNEQPGSNGGWLRRCSLTTTAIGMSVDEDQDRDPERMASRTDAGIIVFSEAFDYDYAPRIPVASFRLDECDITSCVIEDSAGGNDGSDANGFITIDDARLCRTGSFDGTNDKVIGTWNQSFTNSVSLAAWIKTSGGHEANARIVEFSRADGHYTYSTALAYDATGTIIRGWTSNSSGTRSTEVSFNLASNGFHDDQWHYIVYVYDGSTAKLYVDGALKTSASTNISDVQDGLTFVIGGYYSDSSYNFNGFIDEVQIFDVPLSGDDITTFQTNILAENNYDGSSRICQAACGFTIDHFEIHHDGTALTCQPESITIKACADASCATLAPCGADIVLLPTGWVDGDGKSFSSGTAVFELQKTTPGIVTLAIDSSTPTPIDIPFYKCFENGVEGNCDIEFHDSGFILDTPSHIACKPATTATISAVKADDAGQQCIPTFANRTETINFWSTYIDPATPANPADISVNGTVIGKSEPASTAISLTFNASGVATLTTLYPEAGQIKICSKWSGSGDEAGLTMNGSNTFVVRPDGLCVYSDDVNADCAAGDVSCSKFTQAGQSFTLKAKGVCWQVDGESNTDFCTGNTTTRNFQLASIAVSQNLVSPNPGQLGTLGVTTFDMIAADEGEHQMTTQSISEVGVFTFTADPPDYLGAGDVIPSSTSANIGRFYPDHFTTSISNGSFADSCTLFTYTGQLFSYSSTPIVTITAEDSSNNTIFNYKDSFQKLIAAGITLTYPSQDTVQLGNDAITLMQLTANQDTAVLSNGSPMTYTLGADDFTYTRTLPINTDNSRIGPFTNSLDILLSAVADSDGVTATDLGTPKSISPAGGEIRYGRAYVPNGFGPEDEDISLPLVIQYFDGSTWLTNSDDNCTDAAYTVTSETGIEASYAPASPLSASSGRAALVLSPQNDTGDLGGTINLDFDFDAWLEPDSSAEVVFGIFRGNDRIINRYEIIR